MLLLLQKFVPAMADSPKTDKFVGLCIWGALHNGPSNALNLCVWAKSTNRLKKQFETYAYVTFVAMSILRKRLYHVSSTLNYKSWFGA